MEITKTLLVGLAARMAFAVTLFSSLSSFALPPEAAVKLLYGPGQEVHYDNQGYSYRVFRVQESDVLKELIDEITGRLLQTSIGEALCRYVLEAKPRALMHHLAMTPEAARTASSICSTTQSDSPFVFDNPNNTLRKITMYGSDSPRQYIIVVTNQPNLPFDSWTDAYTNKTTLFVYNSKVSSDLNLRHLTQIIAHEMAIYFDAKSWPMGPEWNRIPQLAATQLRSKNDLLVLSSVLNPALATVLALIRAYKIEYRMLTELKAKGLLGPDALFYGAKYYPFLYPECDAACIERFIEHQQSWMVPIQHALLAFSPHYRARRLEVFRSMSAPLPPHEVIDSLEQFPTTFLADLKSDLVSLDLVTLNRTAAELKNQEVINRAMSEYLIPADLKALSEAKIRDPSSGQESELLRFLSVPLLSDSNANLAAGPRPRIRTGGTK